MPLSTSRRGSSERRLRWLSLGAILGAPLVWLTAVQTGYVLAYQACDTQTRAWVLGPLLASAVVVGAIFAATSMVERSARGTREPQPLLAWMSIGVTALMAVVMTATLVGPLLLRPCD